MADPEATGTEKAGAVVRAALGRLGPKVLGAMRSKVAESRKDVNRMAKAFDLDIPKKKILDKSERR